MTTPLVATGVLGASLLGSLHCVGMCGGFACLASGESRAASTDEPQPAGGHAASLAAPVAYHAGRLAAYTTLGAFAGLFGAGIEQAGALIGIARAASVLTGILLVLWGAARLAPLIGVRLGGQRLMNALPDRWARASGGVLLALRTQPPAVRGAALGLVTSLMPCGWLWAFVVASAGAGTPAGGAMLMAVFWLGTVPALVAVAAGVHRVSGRLARHLPLASAALVIGVGFASLAGRLLVPMHAHAGHAQVSQHAGHSDQSAPAAPPADPPSPGTHATPGSAPTDTAGH